MKNVIFRILILLLCLYSCKSSFLIFESTDYTLQRFEYDISRYVKLYYTSYLEYPDTEKLWLYCWEITNSANNYRFQSFTDYEKAGPKDTNATGAESFLRFLSNNKKRISLKKEKGKLLVLLNGKEILLINHDYCEMKNDQREQHNLYRLFDSLGVSKPIDFDDEKTFYNLRKQIHQKHYSSKPTQESYEKVLLRYDRDRGYKVYCLSASIDENDYLKELATALDTFLLNRKEQMIQFVTDMDIK